MNPDPDPERADITPAGRLLLAGAGKMGGALLDGWLAKGLEAARVIIIDPHAPADALERFAARGVTINPAAPQPVDTLVLAIKPQTLADASLTLSRWVAPITLVLSIVAGKTIADLKAALAPAGQIVRAMPNTPAAVRRGVTGVYADPNLPQERRREVSALLAAVGIVEWLDTEEAIDAVTAVSGSGPAYVFYLTECLAAAAEAEGLPAEAAARLARATVEGAAALMAAEPSTSPATLRANVTSPGGTTAAALAVLTADNRLERAMVEAVAAAAARARQLSG